MSIQKLIKHIEKQKSFVCVGLDIDPDQIPPHLGKEEDPLFAFNKEIIDSTKAHCVAYKINTAFYEALGWQGWKLLEKTCKYVPSTHFSIADAKRGDIPYTSKYYAKAFFETMNFDAITLNPFIGTDSIKPYLDYPQKQVIILAHTSNPGSQKLQDINVTTDKNKEMTYSQYIIETFTSAIDREERLGFVIGATQTHALERLRKRIPRHFLLIPGIGTQGGNVEKVIEIGGRHRNFLIHLSRSVIYAGDKEDFALKAAEVCIKMNQKTSALFHQ